QKGDCRKNVKQRVEELRRKRKIVSDVGIDRVNGEKDGCNCRSSSFTSDHQGEAVHGQGVDDEQCVLYPSVRVRFQTEDRIEQRLNRAIGQRSIPASGIDAGKGTQKISERSQSVVEPVNSIALEKVRGTPEKDGIFQSGNGKKECSED